MLSSGEMLKKIIHYDKLPGPPVFMKAGFVFDYRDYPTLSTLESITMVRDNIAAQLGNTASRSMAFKSQGPTVFLNIYVSSQNCMNVRDHLLEMMVSMVSLPLDNYTVGPLDIGEFSVVLKAQTGKGSRTIAFVRNNVGVEISVREGLFDAEYLARQVDSKIVQQKNYDANSLQSLVPQIKEVKSPHKIEKDTKFEVSIDVDSKEKKDDLDFAFGYDGKMLLKHNLGDQPVAVFSGKKDGETVIHCVVVRKSDLLSNSRDVKVIIADK